MDVRADESGIGSAPTGATPATPATGKPTAGDRRIAPLWRLGMAVNLACAALLRLWHLPSTNGIGHVDYTSAVVSMSRSWLAFLTGGVDTGGFITIEKPAVWLWPSALLVKAFGVNWATLFLPDAVAGVASVLVIGLAVREAAGYGRAGHVAALLAALGLAVSPINVAIDRVNTPDGMLVLVALLAAWLLLRAVRRGRMAPLLGSAALIGLGFDVKFFAAYLVLPAFAAVWLVCGCGSVRRRLGWLASAGGTLVLATLVWPLAVALIPAGRRPWFGGSNDGSVVSAAFGTVGTGRLFGQSTAPAGVPQDSTAGQLLNAFRTGYVFHSGNPGPVRLITGVLADQVSWLVPLAVLSAIGLAVHLRGRRRTDPAVAGLVLWSSWLVCCWAVFSFMRGVLHPYYTTLLVPAAAALCASGVVAAWTSWRAGSRAAAAVLTGQVLVGAGWAAWVLHGTTGHRPAWLIPLVAVTGVLTALLIWGVRVMPANGGRAGTVAVAGLMIVALLAAPLLWSARTTTPRLNYVNPLANPVGREDLAGLPPDIATVFQAQLTGVPTSPDPHLLAYLEHNRGGARWIAAVPGVLEAAPLIITSRGDPVMALGGFGGTDPVPTLATFRRMVATGQVRYLIIPGPPPGATPPAGSGPPGGAQAGGAQAGAAPPGGAQAQSGGGGLVGDVAQVMQWGAQRCRPVDPASYGAARPAAGSTAPVMMLFDCAGAS